MSRGEKNAFRILVVKTKERGKLADGKILRWIIKNQDGLGLGSPDSTQAHVSGMDYYFLKNLCFIESAGETLRLQQQVDTYESGSFVQLSYLGKTEVLCLKPTIVRFWPHKPSRNRTRASDFYVLLTVHPNIIRVFS